MKTLFQIYYTSQKRWVRSMIMGFIIVLGVMMLMILYVIHIPSLVGVTFNGLYIAVITRLIIETKE